MPSLVSPSLSRRAIDFSRILTPTRRPFRGWRGFSRFSARKEVGFSWQWQELKSFRSRLTNPSAYSTFWLFIPAKSAFLARRGTGHRAENGTGNAVKTPRVLPRRVFHVSPAFLLLSSVAVQQLKGRLPSDFISWNAIMHAESKRGLVRALNFLDFHFSFSRARVRVPRLSRGKLRCVYSSGVLCANSRAHCIHHNTWVCVISNFGFFG